MTPLEKSKLESDIQIEALKFRESLHILVNSSPQAQAVVDLLKTHLQKIEAYHAELQEHWQEKAKNSNFDSEYLVFADRNDGACDAISALLVSLTKKP